MPLILAAASEREAAAPSRPAFLASHPGVGNPFVLAEGPPHSSLCLPITLFFHPLLLLQQIIKQTATTASLESPQLVVVTPEGPGPLQSGRADGPGLPAASTPLPPPTESSPLPSGAWVRIAYGKRLSRWEPDFQDLHLLQET